MTVVSPWVVTAATCSELDHVQKDVFTPCSIKSPVFSIYSPLLLLCIQIHMPELQYPLLHPPIPFPAHPCQAHLPHQPLPCSLRGKCRLWLEAIRRSQADQATDSAWSGGRAHPASMQAIMAQQKPSTCKCSPELLGEWRHRGGFPCSPGQCLAGAWPWQPAYRPCLSPELAITPAWPSASRRSFPRALESPCTFSLVRTHTREHLLLWPVQTRGKLGILLSC